MEIEIRTNDPEVVTHAAVREALEAKGFFVSNIWINDEAEDD